MNLRVATSRAASSGALGPKPVGERELAIKVFEARDAGEARGLMDDHLGLRAPDGAQHRFPVEQVSHNRLHPQLGELSQLVHRARERDHLVTRLNQPRDQPASDCATSASYENSHHCLLELDLAL